jgi:hypothetical protein
MALGAEAKRCDAVPVTSVYPGSSIGKGAQLPALLDAKLLANLVQLPHS